MTQLKSDFLRVLQERGFLYQATHLEELDAKAAAGRVIGYNGFDATADSMHVGHLMTIMLLRWMQKTGHKPIVLMGGGTTKVGDPTDKTEMRKMLSDEEIAANILGMSKVLEKYLDFGDGQAILVNNADWLDKLEYIPFLRDIGRHISVNRMLNFDSVRTRLERQQPLTLLEFNYSVMQGYDFVELNRRYGCTLQTGGSDQWTNMLSGVELGRKITHQDMFALTTPLLTTSSGQKMGKTAGNAVWLNDDKFSPYEYYQFWRNTEDADVVRFLKFFTDLPLDEIVRLEALQGQEINEAKKILALEATTLCHGKAAAEQAATAAKQTFEDGALAEGLPTRTLSSLALDPAQIVGMEFVSLATLALDLSKSELRRRIDAGAIRLNDGVVTDYAYKIQPSDIHDGQLKVSASKKVHVRITVG